MAEGYDIVQSQIDIFYDEETNTVVVGPYEKEEGQFEEFIRTKYPGADIEFKTPRLQRNIKAEKKAQGKAAVQAQIAEIEQQLKILKSSGRTGEAYGLIREKEALEKKLAEI